MDSETITVRKWKLTLKAQLDQRLTRADVLCLCYVLERFNQKSGCAWPSFNTISTDLKISLSTAQRSVARLKSQGYITIKPGNRTASNRYRPDFRKIINWTPGWCEKSTTDEKQKAKGMVTDDHRGMVTDDHKVYPQMTIGYGHRRPSNLIHRTISNTHTETSSQDQSISSGRDAGKVCEENYFEEGQPLEGSENGRLEFRTSPEEYIRLKLKWAKANPDKVKSLTGLENHLRKEAKNGTLCMTDLEQLRFDYDWNPRRIEWEGLTADQQLEGGRWIFYFQSLTPEQKEGLVRSMIRSEKDKLAEVDPNDWQAVFQQSIEFATKMLPEMCNQYVPEPEDKEKLVTRYQAAIFEKLKKLDATLFNACIGQESNPAF